MVNIKLFLYLFDKNRLFNILLGFSLLGIIPLADFILVVKISHLMGNFLSLSLVSSLSGIALLLLINSLDNCLEEIKGSHISGFYEKSFLLYIGMLPSAILILIPGIISTLMGLLFLLKNVRILFGKFFTEKFQIDWKESYEYFYLLYK